MAKLKVKFNFKKIDAKWVKQFLLAKGEKVVLGIVLVIGFLLVARGFIAASGANRNDDGHLLMDDIKKDKTNAENAVATAVVPAVPLTQTDRPWQSFTKHLANFFNYFQLSETADRTRGTPKILPLFAENIKMDYFKGGLLAYEIDIDNKKASIIIPPGQEAKTGAKLAHTILPRRTIIVSALFPAKEQLEEFINSLKLRQNLGNNVDDDKPQLLGINVKKIEKDDKGKVLSETDLFKHDSASDKTAVADHLDDVYRRAILDADLLRPFANHRIFPGLMTIPFKLASADYPPLVLPNFSPVKADVAEKKEDPENGDDPPKEPIKPKPMGLNPIVPNKKKTEPGKQAEEAPLAKIAVIPWTKPPAKAHKDQFEGNYPVFDGQQSTGTGEDSKGDKKGAIPFPIKPPEKMPTGPKAGVGKDPKGEPDPVIVDPLIRFIDVDVKPGYSYAYKIQVRLKNPNFGREDLAVLAQANDKELLSPWTTTPFLTVPSDEAQFYVTDQHVEEVEVKEPKKDGPMDMKDPKGILKKEKKKDEEKEKEVKKGPQPRGPDFHKLDGEKAPVQIHRWVDWVDKASQRGIVADWIIAERLLVRRGEYIGRAKVVVEVPTWSIQKNDFEMINWQPPEDPKKKPALPKPTGIALDFTLGKTPPVLVDFEGGHRKLRGGAVEESPLELLIVTGDGKLMMQNSQTDTNDKERIERYNAYRKRLDDYARPVHVEEDTKTKTKDKKGPRGFKGMP